MSSSFARVLGGLILLLVRGVLLWILIPLGFIAWLATAPMAFRRAVTLGQFLGWLDSNLVAFLQKSVLRPFYPTPTVDWIPARDISSVTHRIGATDPA